MSMVCVKRVPLRPLPSRYPRPGFQRPKFDHNAGKNKVKHSLVLENNAVDNYCGFMEWLASKGVLLFQEFTDMRVDKLRGASRLPPPKLIHAKARVRNPWLAHG